MDGVLLIDKPRGMSFHAVVARVRHALGGPRKGPGRLRVGHAGTLDPFATGLLLVLVGRATRVQSLLMGLPKRYETIARLGACSTTGDPEGEITQTGRMPADPPQLPVGELQQSPPAYSAIRIDGERAYARARRGEVFDIPVRTVKVSRFEQLWRDGDRAAFAIECSAGTYVRSLIGDLGDAYCEELRRTAIGRFEVSDAHPPPPRDGSPLEARERLSRLSIPLAQALDFLPAVWLDEEQARVAGHGVAVPAPGGLPADCNQVLLIDAQGPIAVAQPRQAGGLLELKPTIGLRA